MSSLDHNGVAEEPIDVKRFSQPVGKSLFLLHGFLKRNPESVITVYDPENEVVLKLVYSREKDTVVVDTITKGNNPLRQQIEPSCRYLFDPSDIQSSVHPGAAIKGSADGQTAAIVCGLRHMLRQAGGPQKRNVESKESEESEESIESSISKWGDYFGCVMNEHAVNVVYGNVLILSTCKLGAAWLYKLTDGMYVIASGLTRKSLSKQMADQLSFSLSSDLMNKLLDAILYSFRQRKTAHARFIEDGCNSWRQGFMNKPQSWKPLFFEVHFNLRKGSKGEPYCQLHILS